MSPEQGTETALYFPYVKVPETTWFSQVLLYWDQAAMILPFEIPLGASLRATPYTDELINARLLRPILAEETLGKDVHTIDDGFISLLDSQTLPEVNDSNAQILLSNWKLISDELLDELFSRGLASDGRPEISMVIEQGTLELFMTYIAGLLSHADASLFPVTDSRQMLASLASPDDSPSRLRALRYAVIANALPVPSQPVPVSELASFKETHTDQLRRLQRYLNGQLAEVAAIEDQFLQQVKLASVLEEIRDDVAILHEQMSKRSWPKVTFAGVGGVAASALGVASIAASGGKALSLALGISGGALSLGPAIYQAKDLLHSLPFDPKRPLLMRLWLPDLAHDCWGSSAPWGRHISPPG